MKCFKSSNSKKDKQYNGQMKRDKQTNNGQHNTTPKIEDWATHKFEDNKKVISSRKSKDRHYNGQEKKDKTANSGRHTTTQKI